MIEKLEDYPDDTEILLYEQVSDGKVFTGYAETCNAYWVEDPYKDKKGIIIV